MNDNNFLDEIAELWVKLGGDAEGVYWSIYKLADKVKEKIEEKNKKDIALRSKEEQP